MELFIYEPSFEERHIEDWSIEVNELEAKHLESETVVILRVGSWSLW